MNTNGGWGCCAKIWPRPRRPDPTSARPATALPCAVRRRGNPVFVEQWVTAPGCCLVGDINVSGPVDRNTPEAVEPREPQHRLGGGRHRQLQHAVVAAIGDVDVDSALMLPRRLAIGPDGLPS
jgi:hypothetical protein